MNLNTESFPHGDRTMIIPVNLSPGVLAGAARVATFAIARQRFMRIVLACRDDVGGPLAGELRTVARRTPLHQTEIPKQYRFAELFDQTPTRVRRSSSQTSASTRGASTDYSLDASAGPTKPSRSYSRRRKVSPS